MPDLPLALLLLRASRWFDRQVLDRLRDEGWPQLSPAQSLVFAYLDDAGTSPAELARRLGHSRQATQQLLNGLVALDLLAHRPNPARRGGLLVTLTDRGRALAGDARRILGALEADLGADRATQLRSLLTAFEQPDPATVRLAPPWSAAPRTSVAPPGPTEPQDGCPSRVGAGALEFPASARESGEPG